MRPINHGKLLWQWTATSHWVLLQVSDLSAPSCCANTAKHLAGSSEGKTPFSPLSQLLCPHTTQNHQLPYSLWRWETAVQFFILACWLKKRELATKQLPCFFVFPFWFVSLHLSLPSRIPYLGPHSQRFLQNTWFLLASRTHTHTNAWNCQRHIQRLPSLDETCKSPPWLSLDSSETEV